MIDMQRIACTMILELGVDESLIMAEQGRMNAVQEGNAEWEQRWRVCSAHIQEMATYTRGQVLGVKHAPV